MNYTIKFKLSIISLILFFTITTVYNFICFTYNLNDCNSSRPLVISIGIMGTFISSLSAICNYNTINRTTDYNIM